MVRIDQPRVHDSGHPAPLPWRRRRAAVATIVSGVGLDIRNQRATLNGLFPEVIEIMDQYSAIQAPIEIHRAFFATDTLELLDEPHRLFKGTIEKAPKTRAEAAAPRRSS